MSRKVGAARCGEARAAPAQIRPWRKKQQKRLPLLTWFLCGARQTVRNSRFYPAFEIGTVRICEPSEKSEGGGLDFFTRPDGGWLKYPWKDDGNLESLE